MYNRYAIASESDLRSGVRRLAALANQDGHHFGHHLGFQ